jgi:hypothetical protein
MMTSDRRATVRLGTNSCVQLEDEWEALEVVLTDVCEGGMQCRGQEVGAGRVRVGETIRCRFVLPTGDIDCLTRVAWVEPELELAGLFFTSVAEQSREPLAAYCACPF